ncbi:MAG: ABC transporter ATP-binding protein [Acidobacteriota bacterium]
MSQPDAAVDLPALRADGLAIGHGRRPILEPLDVGLPAGQLVCLLGANGAGKSTLIRTLGGLLPPLAGQVWLGDAPLRRLAPAVRARRLGLVLTERPSVGHLTARDLVALGRVPHTDWSGALRDADRRAVADALEAVGATALADRDVLTLSDGERQRVQVARALAQTPRVLLLDEPTAFLDLPTRVALVLLLRRLAHEEGLAVLLAVHDLDLALRVADRLWLIGASSDGETASMRVGAPEDLVLSGAIARAFDRGGMAFDPYEGSFRPPRGVRGTARIVDAAEADPLVVRWTSRALVRAGYLVAAEADDAAVRVWCGGAPDGSWRIAVGDEAMRDAESLGALVAAVI